MKPKLAEIYAKLTELIRIAEETEAPNRGWVDVSELEEKVAEMKPQNSVEGGYARRGAIRAAVMSGDKDRAIELFKKYIDEGANWIY